MINKLNHAYTPASLRQLNEQLAELLVPASDLSENVLSEEEKVNLLQKLIKQRDTIVQAHLASLDGPEQDVFAQAELTVNNLLIELAQSLLNSAKNDMSHFMKSQSAIKKYK